MGQEANGIVPTDTGEDTGDSGVGEGQVEILSAPF